MKQYLQLLSYTLKNGIKKQDRTNTGTISVFGYQMRFNLENNFPLLTTKKLHIKSIIYELLWFLKGDTNIKFLQENNITIWNEWADEKGELGNVYGHQWRKWETKNGEIIDQITELIQNIQQNPDSRRHIVSAWNVGEISEMALPPCHILFQFYVANGKLYCHLYQRSADIFLGLPFNIASYSLLTMMIAQVCNLQPAELIISLGDAHIYLNHIEQVNLQLSRKPLELPQMNINPTKNNIFDFKYSDFEIVNYNPYPAIKAEIAV